MTYHSVVFLGDGKLIPSRFVFLPKWSDSVSERCVATDEICVKGFGMLPNKILQEVSNAEILQNARVGTAVPCLLRPTGA